MLCVFLLRGMPLGGIPCLKTGRFLFFLFTQDALRGHTVSKNGSISYFFFLRGMPLGGIPCLKTGRFLFFLFFFFFLVATNRYINYAGCPEGVYRV